MLAGAHHLLALAEMHLGRGGEDHGVGALDAFRKIAGEMLDAVFLGDLGGRVLIAADQRSDFHVGNALQRVEMFLAKRTLAGNADLHAAFLAFALAFFFGAAFFAAAFFAPTPFCRMM